MLFYRIDSRCLLCNRHPAQSYTPGIFQGEIYAAFILHILWSPQSVLKLFYGDIGIVQ